MDHDKQVRRPNRPASADLAVATCVFTAIAVLAITIIPVTVSTTVDVIDAIQLATIAITVAIENASHSIGALIIIAKAVVVYSWATTAWLATAGLATPNTPIVASLAARHAVATDATNASHR